jgi:hypothetical protein
VITTIAQAGPAMWAGLIVAGAVAVVPPLAWLIGLALALRKSAPVERADILRAYATLRLPTVRGGRGGGDNGTLNAGQLADAGKTDMPVK